MRSERIRCARALVAVLLCWAGAALAADVGQRAPPIHATLLDGTPFDSTAAMGKVVVVNFWATWCAPCREEMPALDAYYRQHRAAGMVMVAMSMDDAASLGKVRALAANYAFPVAMASATRLPGYGRIWHLPMTIVIDRDGILRENDWTADNGLDAAALEHVLGPLLRVEANTSRPSV